MDTKAYLEKKSAITFDFLNVDKTGILTLDQMLLFPRNLEANGHHQVAERATAVYTEYFKRLCEAAGKGKNAVPLVKKEFITGNEVVRKTEWYMQQFLLPVSDIYFDSVDHNKDGVISLEEWRKVFNTRGVTDDNFIQSTFAKLDPDSHGVISREKFKYAFVQFGSGENQNEDYSFLYDTGHTM